MTTAGPHRALVIGGPVGGLFAANLLRAAGLQVTVFERATDDLAPRPLGAGLVARARLDAYLEAGPVRGGRARDPDAESVMREIVSSPVNLDAMRAPAGSTGYRTGVGGPVSPALRRRDRERSRAAPPVPVHVFLAAFLLGASHPGGAEVVAADHALYGPGALTRDTLQGLDFLDVPLSGGRSFAQVSGELGPGGDFAGFRYATEAEVVRLINHYGFSPGAAAGRQVIGDTGGDQLSGLVKLLGATQNASTFRASGGITGSPAGEGTTRVIGIADFVSVRRDDYVGATAVLPGTTSEPVLGSFLVRPVPAEADP